VDRVTFFFKIFIVTFLIAGAVFLIKSSNPILSFIKVPSVDVKGVSTEKAQKVTSEISSDIGDGVDAAKKQVFNIKIGDIVNIFSRFQKIPHDVQHIQMYVKEQVDGVVKSKQ
jgi:hypothetical protein